MTTVISDVITALLPNLPVFLSFPQLPWYSIVTTDSFISRSHGTMVTRVTSRQWLSGSEKKVQEIRSTYVAYLFAK